MGLLAALAIGCGTSDMTDGGAGGDAGDAQDAGPPAATNTDPVIPTPTGPCPDFSASGLVGVEPMGLAPRDAQIWISDAAATLDGPVIFYWHGTGSQPREAEFGLGQETIDAVLALGGMVIAPYRDPNAGTFPWYLTAGAQLDDLFIADELLGCAAQEVGVDAQRIHSIGMSAGGLHTTQMSYRRASYLASVVTYSGGLLAGRPRTDNPDNRFAALIFHGGPSDVVVIGFEAASESYWQDLSDRDHFATICDHGLGHRIPDARASVWQFFQDHPWGTAPSPYAGSLPSSFPAYCGLAP